MYPEPYRREGTKRLYFNYIDPVTGKRKLQTCGTARVGEAKKRIKEFIDNLTACSGFTFREYAERFCDYETNPRAQRLKLYGRHYGKKHIEDLKSKLERFVYPDPISSKGITDIIRGGIFDLQRRLARQNPDIIPTINKTLKHVASIFSEGYLRVDIKTNPAQLL